VTSRSHLESLARAFDVQAGYEDAAGRHRRASDEALVAVLRGLGAPIEHADDAPDALRHEHERHWGRVLEPVHVVWEGERALIRIRLPEPRVAGGCRVEIECEDGTMAAWTSDLQQLVVEEAFELGDRRFVQLRVPIPHAVPVGYHTLGVEAAGVRASGWLLCAPARVHVPEALRTWGAFAPTYALHDAGEAGAGHLGHLRRLVDFIGGMGGGVVGTLPLLAAFLDEPFEPSPYAPASRLAWNEMALDLEALPEATADGEVRRVMADWQAHRRESADHHEPWVDHGAHWGRMRPVIDRFADIAFGDARRRDEMARFAREHADLAGYARFRAVLAAQGCPWHRWPETLREGPLHEGAGDPAVYRRHLYGQWRLTQQLDALADHARRYGPGLYLDFPLGVHPEGYDVWRERDAFVSGVAAGAPPDDFFTRGQNWGFPPLHPRAIRERGYKYVAACLRSQMRRAGMLRIDHVMWLHRLFFVPDGMEAPQGVYVRYHPDELYAVLAIESHRHRSSVIGEDLGTVPQEVRDRMDQHGVLRMYVLQFETGPDGVREAPVHCAASVNTHDMPPFAAYWRGLDVQDRVQMGLATADEADDELAQRAKARDALRARVGVDRPDSGDDDAGPVLRGALRDLAAGPARVVLVTLEDLWLEERAQNVPGTGAERPNWRGRIRVPLNALPTTPAVTGPLAEIDERRRARP
jgi:4-alpha-glucanotransferase